MKNNAGFPTGNKLETAEPAERAYTAVKTAARGGDSLSRSGHGILSMSVSAAGQKANHIVSAVDGEGFCLGETLVDGKSNEITAIPELLKSLNIRPYCHHGRNGASARYRKARQGKEGPLYAWPEGEPGCPA